MPKSIQLFVCASILSVALAGCGSDHGSGASMPEVQATNNAKPEMTITAHRLPAPEPAQTQTPLIKPHRKHRRKHEEPPPTEPPIDTDAPATPPVEKKPPADDGGNTPTTEPPPSNDPTPPDPIKPPSSDDGN